jgi:ribosome biogenesis protein Tsr3
MKNYILLILIFSNLVNADFYKVNVKREATNVYKDYNSGILIFTANNNFFEVLASCKNPAKVVFI